jgi:tRNA1(Val) A37 N6-methylase TrmN6
MIKECYLPNHKEIKIFQSDELFKINTDTQVLGEFLNIYKEDVVLDMGTNTGALLLYANLFHPKKLIGLEINEKALELAKKNLDYNNISNYELINGDINTYTNDPVDVIICNPPYFKTKIDNMSNDKYKNLAKHETDLKLDSLIKSISRNLKDNGTLFFLYLTSRLDEVVLELNKNNLKIKEMKFVYDTNKEYSNVFLIRAVKNSDLGLVVDKPIIIKRDK